MIEVIVTTTEKQQYCYTLKDGETYIPRGNEVSIQTYRLTKKGKRVKR